MIDCVRSGAVRKYLAEKGIELEDKLKYALVMNDNRLYPMEDVIQYLTYLAAVTADDEVREQAGKSISQFLKHYESFGQDRGPSYYYYLMVYDKWSKNYEPGGSFRTLNLAETVGRKKASEDGTDFRIELKYIAQNEEEGTWFDDSGVDQSDGGEAVYNEEGKLLYCICFADGMENDIEDPIEDRWFPFPHPFRRGDILRSVNEREKDMRYIVLSCAGDDEIQDQYDCHKWRFEDGLSPSWDCTTFRVLPVSLKTGNIWEQDAPMYPYDFEYAEVSDDYENVRDQVLIQMSRMVKGEPCFMQYIQNGLQKLHEDYDNEERYQLLTGIKLKKSTVGGIG